jgi:hypothetical protein
MSIFGPTESDGNPEREAERWKSVYKGENVGTAERCRVRGCTRIAGGPHDECLCAEHCRVFPPALAKAASDPFMYAIGLVTGEVVYFHMCVLWDGGWVTLHPESDIDGFLPGHGQDFRVRAQRGLDVRVDHVVWCADAPDGS